MKRKTTKVLILGGTSYVAQFLCRFFLDGHANDGAPIELACTIRASDAHALTAGLAFAPDGANKREVRVFPGASLLALESVTAAIDAFQPTVVVNCIAMASPAACERDPTTAHALNHPSGLIAYVLTRSGPPIHYMHFSTDFVYDGRSPPPQGYKEDDAVASVDQCVYGATKLAFDDHLMALPPSSTHLRTTVLRIANVVGGPAPLFHDQPPKFAQWLWHELISPHTIAAPVRLWGDEVRSFLFVDDLVRIVWALLRPPPRAAATATTQLFNVGGVDALSRVQFAQRLLQQHERLQATTTRTVPCRAIQSAERAAVDLGYQSPLDSRLDCSKLQTSLGGMFRFSSTEQIMRSLCAQFDSLM